MAPALAGEICLIVVTAPVNVRLPLTGQMFHVLILSDTQIQKGRVIPSWKISVAQLSRKRRENRLGITLRADRVINRPRSSADSQRQL